MAFEVRGILVDWTFNSQSLPNLLVSGLNGTVVSAGSVVNCIIWWETRTHLMLEEWVCQYYESKGEHEEKGRLSHTFSLISFSCFKATFSGDAFPDIPRSKQNSTNRSHYSGFCLSLGRHLLLPAKLYNCLLAHLFLPSRMQAPGSLRLCSLLPSSAPGLVPLT